MDKQKLEKLKAKEKLAQNLVTKLREEPEEVIEKMEISTGLKKGDFNKLIGGCG